MLKVLKITTSLLDKVRDMRLFALTAVCLFSFAASASASITIASTDFDGRSVSGATASSLTWILNGVADPGDLTTDAPDGLFDTADAQDRFAVDRNIHTEGTWSVDIPLDIGGAAISLGTVTLDAFIYNNGGRLQTVGRDLDLTIELLLGVASIATDVVNDIFPGGGAIVQPVPVSFDLSGNTLLANTDYTLRLTASGTGPGNNAGIDNLSINANVPEPMSILVWSGLLGAVGLVTRRRQAS